MSEHEHYEQTNECANKRCARPLGRWSLNREFCDKCESELREAEGDKNEQEN